MTNSEILIVVAAFIGAINALKYAYHVARGDEVANLATWGIILVIDVIGFSIAKATRQNFPYMELGWCIAVVLIVGAAACRFSVTKFVKLDLIIVALCACTLYVWLSGMSTNLVLAAFSSTVLLSVVPQAGAYIEDPVKANESLYMWQVSTLSLFLTLVAKHVEPNTGAADFVGYYTYLAANLYMMYLCRKR